MLSRVKCSSIDMFNLIQYKHNSLFKKTKTCKCYALQSIPPAQCVAVNVLFSNPNPIKSENGAGLRRRLRPAQCAPVITFVLVGSFTVSEVDPKR